MFESAKKTLQFDTSLDNTNTRNLVGGLQSIGNQPRPGKPTGGNTLINSTRDGVPSHVQNVNARQFQVTSALTHIAVTFTRNPNDHYYRQSLVYVTGYKGNNAPVLVASGDSPIKFSLDNTGERVGVVCVASGDLGSAFIASAPSSVINLGANPNLPNNNKAATAIPTTPAAPTGTATPLGNRISLPVLDRNLDFKDGHSHQIYRSLSNNFATAVRIGVEAYSPAGQVVHTDKNVVSGTTYFYWHTNVNQAYVESNPGPSVAITAAPAVSDTDVADGTVYGRFHFGGTPTNGSPVTNQTLVSNALVTGGAIAQWASGNAITIPANIEFDVLANGGLIDILLPQAGAVPLNGYMARFDARSGQVAGSIWLITTGTWTTIGTAKAAANAANLTGWNRVRIQVGTGRYDIFVNGMWMWTAIDATYTPNGSVWYGYEVAQQRITPSGFVNITQLKSLPLTAAGGFTAAGILTQVGTTKQINVASSTGQFGSNAVTYNSGSVTPASYGLKYIYCDDTSYSGGAVTYVATINQIDLLSSDARVSFGSITTAVGGGGSGGGGSTCFTPSTLIKTKRGAVSFEDIEDGDEVWTARGTWRKVLTVTAKQWDGYLLMMPNNADMVTAGHKILYDNTWQRYDFVYPTAARVRYTGPICNLWVEAEEDDDGSSPTTEHSYQLATSGLFAHNLMPTT